MTQSDNLQHQEKRMNSFEKKIEVRWPDCDPNRHVRHSTYYDYGAHSRIRYFSKIGFSAVVMEKLKIGPILFKEECTFIKELSLEDTIVVNLLKGDISTDGKKWVLHHEIFNSKNEKCAHITVFGAWIDLEIRKLTTPPLELANALHELPPGSNYVHKKSE